MLEDKIKAAAKDAEGRRQVAACILGGDVRLQAEGQAKQIQAQIMDAADTVKDQAQRVAPSCPATMKLAGRRQARWPVG